MYLNGYHLACNYTVFFKVNLGHISKITASYNTIQYNFIAKCQYTDCTRNVHHHHMQQLDHQLSEMIMTRNLKMPSGYRVWIRVYVCILVSVCLYYI